MPKINELKALREALEWSQAQMGEALGIIAKNAQGTWHRWESDPTKPSAKKALEKAKAVYLREKGKPWDASLAHRAMPPGATLSMVREYGAQYLEEAEIQRVTNRLPEYVAQAYSEFCALLDLKQATPADVDRAVVGRVVGKAARELARGTPLEEVQRELRADADVFLRILR